MMILVVEGLLEIVRISRPWFATYVYGNLIWYIVTRPLNCLLLVNVNTIISEFPKEYCDCKH